MSQSDIALCSLILGEHFGAVGEKVASQLLCKGPSPLRQLTALTGFNIQQVPYYRSHPPPTLVQQVQLFKQ
jgi:hypothetical protein